MIVHAPVLHLPARSSHFYLECDSSIKLVGSVLYQIQKGTKHVIAFYSATMQHAACKYSNSELELSGLKKSLLHFQHVLKYSIFTVFMDHNVLNVSIVLTSLRKLSVFRNVWKKFLIFHLIFQHISGKHMFVSDLLSRLSSNNKDEEPIPYFTDTTLLDDASYMSHLDGICQFNYDTFQGVCTSHSFPLNEILG